MSIRSRLEVPHAKDCVAVRQVAEGAWPTAWGVAADDPNVFRNARGYQGRGAHRVWVRFLCNDTGCGAVLLVCADDIFAEVTQ